MHTILLSLVRFYWTPAPPKLHLFPSTIRNQMFPAYQGAPVCKASSETEYETVQGTLEDSDDDEDNWDNLDPEDVEARQRCFFPVFFLYLCLEMPTTTWDLDFHV
jgi:hypothetical protein